MIDFEADRQFVKELIESSLGSFAAERPGVAWSTFALYACPWAGWITACFDSEANSAQTVAAIEANGPDWYGEDEWGRFNNNCPNFQFVEWRLLSLPHWQGECEAAEPIHVRDLSGQDHFIGSENEAINGLVFAFLRKVLLAEMQAMTGSRFLPRARYRFGVQLLDSGFLEFWQGPARSDALLL